MSGQETCTIGEPVDLTPKEYMECISRYIRACRERGADISIRDRRPFICFEPQTTYLRRPWFGN